MPAKENQSAASSFNVAERLLDGSNDSYALNAFNSQGPAKALQNRVCTETFPIPASSWFPSQWSDRRSEVDIDAFASEFFTDCHTSGMHQIFIERSTHGNPRRESSVVVRIPHTQWTVL
jgi:hypothetical protein